MPVKPLNLVGQTFSRLYVESFDKRENSQTWWNCICSCGNIKSVPQQNLRNGKASSCGCYAKEVLRNRFATHGQTGTRLHRIWLGMRSRCTYKSQGTERYFGRGIDVCSRWRCSFENFRTDMGNPPSDAHSIDRIDVDGDYTPDNCRWATQKEQNRNKKNNRVITIDGISKTMIEWEEILEMPRMVLFNRLKYGWSEIEAIKTPSAKGRKFTRRDVRDCHITQLLNDNAPTSNKANTRRDSIE